MSELRYDCEACQGHGYHEVGGSRVVCASCAGSGIWPPPAVAAGGVTVDPDLLAKQSTIEPDIAAVVYADRSKLYSDFSGGVTEAMVTRAMDRAGWTTKPTPPEYETCNGALIDLGISQDEADHINAQLSEEMREILTAALAVGDEGIREGDDA